MAILSKVKSAASNYAKNVVGGAKIVGSAVKNAVSKPAPARAPTPAPKVSVPSLSLKPSPLGSSSLSSSINKTSNSTPAVIAKESAVPSVSGAVAALQRAGSSVASGAKNVASGAKTVASKVSKSFSGAMSDPSIAGTAAAINAFNQPDISTESYGGKTGVARTLYSDTIPKGRNELTPDDSFDQNYSDRRANSEFIKNSEAQRIEEQKELSSLLASTQAELAQKEKEEEEKKKALEQENILINYNPDEDGTIKTLKAQLKALEDDYEKSLLPTDEEKRAKEQEDALVAQEGQVNAELGGKINEVNKEPIPEGFLKGWGNTFNKDAAVKLQTIGAAKVPIQLQLARLAQQRAASMDVKKNRVDAARSAVDRGYTTFGKRSDILNKRKEDREKPFELSSGQTRYQYNPDTGKVEPVASSPKSVEEVNGTVVEAGGRKLLVNPRTGAVIKDLGAADGGREL